LEINVFVRCLTNNRGKQNDQKRRSNQFIHFNTSQWAFVGRV
jgi:hypothetical protein